MPNLVEWFFDPARIGATSSAMPFAPSPPEASCVSRPYDAPAFCGDSEASAGPVLLLGNFDGFHLGHAALLDAGRDAAGGRPVGVLSVEPHPRQFFAPAAAAFRIASAKVKRETFARRGFAFSCAPRFDATFARQSPEAFVRDVLVRSVGVSQVVVGEDFRFGAGRAGTTERLRAMGDELGFGVSVVATVRRQDARCSSSLIRHLLREGEAATAGTLLGDPWTVEARLRRSLGGRVSVAWPDEILRPAPGRYNARLRRLAGGEALAECRLIANGDGFRLDGAGAPEASDLALDIVS
ncbi:hypothetical protein GCM10008179_25720 [Hansschlegelia plantiphila]|uniref:FAD synthase n=2 Tax=Hansschlegelia plantiphila TaxID=374655 RepID=A0A9W6MVY1_9HYPH|nr:hypothetical protein GCM10008179_25720 [Hansschlegelia plantiphila]